MKLPSPSISRRTMLLLFALFAVSGLYAWQEHRYQLWVKKQERHRHVFDEAHVLPQSDASQLDTFLYLIYRESDIDIRIQIVRDTGGRSIEELAVERIELLGIGKSNREERGALALLDLESRKLRIAIGYGLESYFPDAFVSYLLQDHGRPFMSSDNYVIGLHLLARILQHRIRQAVLGEEFNPKLLEEVKGRHYLTGGAGATASFRTDGKPDSFKHDRLSDESRKLYAPQETPGATYELYLRWLRAGLFDPRIAIFTEESQSFMSGMPMTDAYFSFILLTEYGKQYKVIQRNDLALLYFTDDPLVSPHILMRDTAGWRMDIVSEIKHTREEVGEKYTWYMDFDGTDDVIFKAFRDRFVLLGSYVRIRDGDNRALPTRSAS